MRPTLSLSLALSFFVALLFSQASLGSLFAKATALPADKAIQFTTTVTDGALLVNFDLASNIYLYKDKIKLTFPDKSQYTNFSQHKLLKTQALETLMFFLNPPH
jgi:thiol:disulfide interchange protein